MTGARCFSGPNELRAGARLSPAAASAVRPPGFKLQHRGTRSFDAVCRRLSAWRTRVSHVNVICSEAVVIPPNGDTDAAIAIVVGPCESGHSLNRVSSSPATPVTMGEADVARSIVMGFGGNNSIIVEAPSAIRLGSFCEQLRIWSVNVRKLVLRKAELEARLANANVDVLLLQETWLSESVEAVQIAGFYVVGRLDRSEGPKAGFGGVAVYARNSVANIGLLSYSETSERMWCTLHSNLGMFLICNWFRPPDDGDTSISSWQTKCPSSETMWWASFLLAI